MADANDPKTMAPDNLFGFFNSGEAIGGDGEARGEPGREAGGGGFFGDFQSGFPSESAHIGFGEAGFAEGGGHGKLPGGGAAGADFAGVVKIFPISEHIDASEPGQFFHALEKFRTAEVATVRGVGGVGGVFQFQGTENLHRQAVFLGKGQGSGVFRAREAGGVAEDAGDLGTEELVGSPKKKGGVDPA